MIDNIINKLKTIVTALNLTAAKISRISSNNKEKPTKISPITTILKMGIAAEYLTPNSRVIINGTIP